MIRNILLAVAGIATAILLAPTSQAAPKLCDNHGTGPGQIYIHACATGGGGGGEGFHLSRSELASIQEVLRQVQDRANGVGH